VQLAATTAATAATEQEEWLVIIVVLLMNWLGPITGTRPNRSLILTDQLNQTKT
jgi:hypothetical protein